MTQPHGGGGYRHFHEQLTALEERLLHMANRAEDLVDLAVDALRDLDAEKAQQVLARDEGIDTLELQVEQEAIALLALQQPMARDLRLIIGAIKISSDLERVGDHAVNIAQATMRYLEAGRIDLPSLPLAEMARLARAMLGDALSAFLHADGAQGRAVCRRDDEVDALAQECFQLLSARMMQEPASVPGAVQLLLVSRNLERVADLATNIGEDAVYLAEGKTIKHHAEERE